MTDPGSLNRRLTLDAPVETPDGSGGAVRTYEVVTTLWASVMPVGAQFAIDGAQAGATVTHRIVIRSGPVLTTRHRLRESGRVFQIVAFRDADGCGRFIEIAAQERTG